MKRTGGNTGNMAMDVRRLKMKVCLVGEAAVGKTSLIRRFVHDDFHDKYIQTLGTKVSKVELKVALPGETLPVQVGMTIWDIMGQKGFRELLKEAYFYGAKGVIAVCDGTRRSTLDDIDDWIEGVYSVTGRIPITLLANKADLVDRREVTDEQLAQVAKAYSSPYSYTSAKTGENVESAFQGLANLAVQEAIVRAPAAE